jgi:hypothetical protein
VSTATSSLAAGAQHPAFFSFGDREAHILGGSVQSKWRKVSDYRLKGKYTTADDFLSNRMGNESAGFKNFVELELIGGGETYQLLRCAAGICASAGSVKGGKAIYFFAAASGSHHLDIETDPIPADKSAFFIGLQADWNPLPRSVQRSGPSNVSIDLDGDGSVETVIVTAPRAAAAPARPDAPKGKLTIAVQRGAARSTVVETELDDVYSSVWNYGVVDLNGDGKLEIVQVSSGHNTAVGVYEPGTAQSQAVLDWYMGD